MAQISGINSGLAYAPILVKSNQNGLDYQDFLEHHPFPGFTYRWSDGVIDTKRIQPFSAAAEQLGTREPDLFKHILSIISI